jgi:hypothetical protein
VLAISGAWLGFARLTCPQCGMKKNSICESAPRCPVCKFNFINEAKSK